MTDAREVAGPWLLASFHQPGRQYANVPRCIQSRTRVGVPAVRNILAEEDGR